ELIGAYLELAGEQRPVLTVRTRSRALAAADDRLHARDHLLRVARLGDPVVGADPQAAHTLRHARRSGADDDAETGHRLAHVLEELPALRPEQGEIDDQRVQAHRQQILGTRRVCQHTVLPAHFAHALAEHPNETTGGVDYGQSDRAWLDSHAGHV